MFSRKLLNVKYNAKILFLTWNSQTLSSNIEIIVSQVHRRQKSSKSKLTAVYFNKNKRDKV